MKRVLIVDDKEENLYYLQALLKGHGFEVDTARHGAEALVKARQILPKLVVSDLLMPVMDGYTLLRHWKADPVLNAVPFIVYTATYTEAEDERLALGLGADAFILKPAEPEDFLARIRTVLARSGTTSPFAPQTVTGKEHDLLKVYSETLIRKLEEKSLQLELSNRALQEDVAHRQRAEDDLRESEDRFRATFEQAAVGLAHVGVDGRFMRVNDKLCTITGYPREELIQRTFVDLTVPEDRAEAVTARLAILAGKQTDFSSEKRYQRKGGEVIWVNVVTSLLRDAAGEPKYFITVVSDITERRKLEQQFLRSQRMESIGTLAGGIAHDLNNLLAPIMLGVNILKTNPTGASSPQVIDNIERSAKRAASLVRQVLSFARGVDGQRVPLHVRHVIEEIESIVEGTFPKNITFKIDLAADLWRVLGDHTQINQVVLNLCVNARDAMPAGGRLRLRANNVELDSHYVAMNHGVVAGSYVLLEVTDSGTGIPREIVDRIFEPFFTTKEQGKGTGLGLSTVLGIVRSHGGMVNVYSEPGHGTTFKVYLPALRDAETGGGGSPSPHKLPRGKGELVLVVDDETSIVDITRDTLEAFGYRVITAVNGAQAVGLYMKEKKAVGVVITDMMMPSMDGPALIAALRGINPKVRVIAVSGLGSNGDVIFGDAATPNHFLQKPYTAETLLVTLREVMDR